MIGIDWRRIRAVAAAAAGLGVLWGMIALAWWLSSVAPGGAQLAE